MMEHGWFLDEQNRLTHLEERQEVVPVRRVVKVQVGFEDKAAQYVLEWVTFFVLVEDFFVPDQKLS